jgi:tRNA (cytidine/uridine-2'-O-)-methyltransferase
MVNPDSPQFLMPRPLFRLALLHLDIPQNCGAAIRLAACLGAGLDLIGPLGFAWDEARVRRVAMDYFDLVQPTLHTSWAAFLNAYPGSRLILLTTRGSTLYSDFAYRENDILLLGSESMGAPPEAHRWAAARVFIPLKAGARSLNLVTAAAIVLSEAQRQLRGMGQEA